MVGDRNAVRGAVLRLALGFAQMTAAAVTLGLLVRLGVCSTTVGAALVTTMLTFASRILIHARWSAGRSLEPGPASGKTAPRSQHGAARDTDRLGATAINTIRPTSSSALKR